MLNAQVFEKAADYIDENGWWRSDMENLKSGSYPACIMNAVSHVIGETELPLREAQDAIIEHFQVQSLGDVFALNDTQPLATGKEWATSNLREIAEDIRQRVDAAN